MNTKTVRTVAAAANTVSAAVAFNVWIRSAVGNKEAAAQVRRANVEAAILTCLKFGNTSPWTLGLEEAKAGRGAVAKALVAGFTAVGHLSALHTAQDRKKMEAKDGRTAVDAIYTAAAAEKWELFEAAYLSAMPKEQTEAEKEAAKAAKEAAAAVKLAEAVAQGVKDEISARGLVEADKVMSSADIFRAALATIKAGQMSDDMLRELCAALGVPAMLEARYLEGKAAAESLAADAGAAVAQVVATAKAPRTARTARTAKPKAAQAPAAQEAAAPVAQAEEATAAA